MGSLSTWILLLALLSAFFSTWARRINRCCRLILGQMSPGEYTSPTAQSNLLEATMPNWLGNLIMVNYALRAVLVGVAIWRMGFLWGLGILVGAWAATRFLDRFSPWPSHDYCFRMFEKGLSEQRARCMTDDSIPANFLDGMTLAGFLGDAERAISSLREEISQGQ